MMDISSFNIVNFNAVNRLQTGYAPERVTGAARGMISSPLINVDLSGRQGYREDYSARDAAVSLWRKENLSFNLNDPDSIESWYEKQKARFRNGLPDTAPTEEELTAYIDTLRENGLDGTVDWSGLGRELAAFKTTSPEELSDALDYLASRYAAALDKLERNFSGEELAAQRAKLEEVYQAGKTGMIEGYAQFLRSNLGLSDSDARAVRDSLSTLLNERVEAYRGALDTVYDSLSGPDGAWLKNHDAYIASRLRAAGEAGQSKALYSAEDLAAAGMIARSYETEIINAGRNEAKLALNLAMADMKAEEMIGRGLVSSKMAALLRSSRAQGHRNVLDALDQVLARWEAHNRSLGQPKGVYTPVDSGVFQGIYDAVMGAYKQNGGDVAGAIRAGASYGQTATARSAAKNPHALRWGLGMEQYWKDFYMTPDPREHSALDKQVDALLAQIGRVSDQGSSTYQQYVNQWQEFLNSIGCGLDVRG